MTTPVYPAGATPYCTIPELLAAPTGISLRLVNVAGGKRCNTRAAHGRTA
jgi:hypothetical protein